MKRILSLFLIAVVILLVFSGCGKKKNRILYSDVDFSKAVTFSEYKGIEVNTTSDEFKEIYSDLILEDVLSNNLQSDSFVTEGIIEKGDIVNIDYVGKKDGIAFDGGTASGYDLTIGSNSFIEGFESGLIGKDIGSTVDLNLTFPDEYHSQELAGQKVVFNVKINNAKKALKPKEFYSKLNYKTLEDYEKYVRGKAIDEYLLNALYENSKINKYSDKDKEYLTNEYIKMMSSTVEAQYNITFADYLSSIGQTEEEYEKMIVEEYIKPAMDLQMRVYGLLDNEGIDITSKEIENKITQMAEQYNGSVTGEQLKEYYGEYYFENLVAKDKALKFMRENAKIS